MELRKNLKKMAEILIEQSFPDKPNSVKEKYKEFNLTVTATKYRSRLGCYNMLTKTIELSGINDECRHDIIITYIHELSHHIEYINTGNSGHQKSFYDIHTTLLKTAVDMEIIKLEDIVDNQTSSAGNRNKLAKMMIGYKKKHTLPLSSYMNTKFLDDMPEIIMVNQTIQVKSLPQNKQILKDMDYKWDASLLVWTKTIKYKEDYNKELEFLRKSGFYNMKIDGKTFFTQTIKISIYGDTYNNKDELVKMGYTYSSRCWSKNIFVKEMDAEIRKLRRLPFRTTLKVKYSFS